MLCREMEPYKKADKENSKMYREYIKEVNYIKHYRLAVELAVIYLISLYEVYFTLKQGKDFTDKHKKRFLRTLPAF